MKLITEDDIGKEQAEIWGKMTIIQQSAAGQDPDFVYTTAAISILVKKVNDIINAISRYNNKQQSHRETIK